MFTTSEQHVCSWDAITRASCVWVSRHMKSDLFRILCQSQLESWHRSIIHTVGTSCIPEFRLFLIFWELPSLQHGVTAGSEASCNACREGAAGISVKLVQQLFRELFISRLQVAVASFQQLNITVDAWFIGELSKSAVIVAEGTGSLEESLRHTQKLIQN